MHAAFTNASRSPVRLHIVSADMAEDWLSDQAPPLAAFAAAVGFRGQAGKLVLAPDADGAIGDVLFGAGDCTDALVLAGASAGLPGGDYLIVTQPEALTEAMLHAGWADGAYRFRRYRQDDDAPPRLVIKGRKALKAAAEEAIAVDLVRDLINTPAQDMGPTQISLAVNALAEEFGADTHVVTGDDLLAENYPMVHAVGRAAADAPRYVELSWGRKDAPHIALVGKGVAFDTGGLNIKTGNYMRIMKKDMGGAAHAMGLARMIMAAELDVRLTLHVPTVENAVGAGAFRPGDVLSSRKGLTVEIDNTDAEGRLILADALARASELEPDLLIDFATLTGAARVAMGADVAPFLTDDDTLATELYDSSVAMGDPMWRLPLWKPYQSMLKSSVADVQNGASSAFAGTITAALFLSRFVSAPSWVHLDVWGWRHARYGRPEGGAAMTLRAIMALLRNKFG